MRTGTADGGRAHCRRDNPTIYPMAFWGPGADIVRVLKHWNLRREAPGLTFNYTELCPLTIGAVIRAATGTSLASLCEECLWKPIGAEADASWCTDAQGQEFNCVNFACRLRDWGRLGRLVANRVRSARPWRSRRVRA